MVSTNPLTLFPVTQYPLSATITAEWSPTQARGMTLVGVFTMQSVARFLAFGINLGLLRQISKKNNLAYDSKDEFLSKLVVDQVWRWVLGIGIFPALIAVYFRLTIPETPRYYANIRKDMRKAVQSAAKVYGPDDWPDLPYNHRNSISHRATLYKDRMKDGIAVLGDIFEQPMLEDVSF